MLLIELNIDMSGVIYKRFLRKCISAGVAQHVPVKRFSVAYNGTFTFNKKQLALTIQGQCQQLRRYSNTTEKTTKTGKSSSFTICLKIIFIA